MHHMKDKIAYFQIIESVYIADNSIYLSSGL
jgi:hypothetical protein